MKDKKLVESSNQEKKEVVMIGNEVNTETVVFTNAEWAYRLWIVLYTEAWQLSLSKGRSTQVLTTVLSKGKHLVHNTYPKNKTKTPHKMMSYLRQYFDIHNLTHVVCVCLSICLFVLHLHPDAWTNRPEIFRGYSQDNWPGLRRMWLGLALGHRVTK